MVSRRVISSVALLGVLAATPVLAEEGERRRGGDRRNDQSAAQSQRTGRAVPRSGVVRSDNAPRPPAQLPREQAQQVPVQRQYQTQAQQPQQYRGEQRAQAQQYRGDQRAQAQRQYQGQQPRQYRDDRYNDSRRDYAVRREYQRPYYPSYSSRYYPPYANKGYGYGYGSRTVIVPRYITPRFVTVLPYRPYVYRPSIGIGVYYGTGGSYPYGYTPRGYYDPIAGRPYGGLRITGFSQLAQVFADGYYVGIVDDFDGVFQHLNLEAGPHQIEIREPGLEPIAFDVMVQSGRTMTFRAGGY